MWQQQPCVWQLANDTRSKKAMIAACKPVNPQRLVLSTMLLLINVYFASLHFASLYFTSLHLLVWQQQQPCVWPQPCDMFAHVQPTTRELWPSNWLFEDDFAGSSEASDQESTRTRDDSHNESEGGHSGLRHEYRWVACCMRGLMRSVSHNNNHGCCCARQISPIT